MKTRAWIAGAMIWLAAVVTIVAAADVKVTPLVGLDGHVSASFAAPTAFTDDAREVVRSGLSLTFTFTVELCRPSAVWFDHKLSVANLAASVKYDNLTRVYQVSKLQEGRVTWSDRTDDEDKMRVWVTAFDGVPLESSEALEPNVDYYVRVRLRASPHRTFSLWPFNRDEGSGRADFTFIR
jgi:hypothetical protein